MSHVNNLTQIGSATSSNGSTNVLEDKILSEANQHFMRILNLLPEKYGNNIRTKERKEVRERVMRLFSCLEQFHGILQEARTTSQKSPTTNVSTNLPVSYADVTKMNTRPTSTTRTINRSLKSKLDNEGSGGSVALILYPKTDVEGETINMQQIENSIIKKIKPHDLKIQVKAIKRVKGDGICFRTNSHKDAETLSNAIEKLPEVSGKIKGKISEGRRPRIILNNVPISVDEPDLIPMVFDQNKALQVVPREEFIQNTRISTVLYRNSAKENCRHIILSTAPRIRDAFVRSKHIAVEWTNIFVNDYIPLVRCYQCCGYNHISTSCPDKQKCSHCAKGHRFADCQRLNQNPTCTNCKAANKGLLAHEKLPTDHNAFHPQCPITQKMKSQTIRQTNYGL
ncbi:uncharacterized protein LOC111624677 [Centruroides sculpturatus]|uniref:uncharacterized protein LOC111624677 n=1 Tax=Centruroides sculpturatus TaxID=218467 RepID=UPI000C6CFBA6|nr:uncharacterized protein LOC111624677 [Centruroides sculpturatus]